jgi:hypothetical protein
VCVLENEREGERGRGAEKNEWNSSGKRWKIKRERERKQGAVKKRSVGQMTGWNRMKEMQDD